MQGSETWKQIIRACVASQTTFNMNRLLVSYPALPRGFLLSVLATWQTKTPQSPPASVPGFPSIQRMAPQCQQPTSPNLRVPM